MLTTKRLTLRAPRADDLDATFDLMSDPRCMKYWSTLPHPDLTPTKELMDRRIAAWVERPVNFQIEREGKLIGHAGNHFENEIGFMLSPDYWRQGYVSEAMHTIIPYLWHVTDHSELTADADPDNVASIGLLTSLGFTETHRAQNTFCIDGTWVHSVYFALPRPTSKPTK